MTLARSALEFCLVPILHHVRRVLWAGWLTCLPILWVMATRAGDAVPHVLGKWPTGELAAPELAVVVGQHAWTTSGAKLQAVNVTDPAAPRWVGEIAVKGIIQQAVATPSHAWLVTDKAGLVVVDISNPSQPRQAGVFETQGRARELALAAPWAYLLENRPDPNGTSATTDIIHILDVTDPSHPRKVGEWTVLREDGKPWEARKLGIGDGILCVARWNIDDDTSRLEVVDIVDPAHPRGLGAYEGKGRLGALTVAGRRAYWALQDYSQRYPRSIFEVVDLNQAASPVRLGVLPVAAATLQIIVSGNLAFVAKSPTASLGGVDILDLTDPTALRRVKTWSIPRPGWATDSSSYPSASGIAKAGELLCVAAGNAGLHFVDVTTADASVRVGGLKCSGRTVAVAVADNKAYVASLFEPQGLVVLDITVPAKPQRLGSVSLSTPPYGVVTQGNYAYLLTDVFGVHVVDVSDPSNPRRVGGISMQTGLSDLSVLGNSLYLASPGDGFYVYDITNPASPRRKSLQPLQFAGWGVRIAVDGNHAYLAESSFSGGTGLGVVEVFDVSDPGAPQWVGSYDTPGPARDIIVRDRKAYVLGGPTPDSGFLEILDVTDPADPTLLGHHDAQVTRHLGVDGGIAWFGGAKVEVLEIANPALPTSLGNLDDRASSGLLAVGKRAYLVDYDDGLTIAEFGAIATTPVARLLPGDQPRTLTLEVQGTAGTTVAVQLSTDLSTWQEMQTLRLESVPSKVRVPADAPAGFLRIRGP